MQQGEAGVEGVEAARLPGAEEGGQRHAGGRARGRARAPADLARDDQRAQHALGSIVIGAQPRHPHELEQLALMAQVVNDLRYTVDWGRWLMRRRDGAGQAGAQDDQESVVSSSC